MGRFLGKILSRKMGVKKEAKSDVYFDVFLMCPETTIYNFILYSDYF